MAHSFFFVLVLLGLFSISEILLRLFALFWADVSGSLGCREWLEVFFCLSKRADGVREGS